MSRSVKQLMKLADAKKDYLDPVLVSDAEAGKLIYEGTMVDAMPESAVFWFGGTKRTPKYALEPAGEGTSKNRWMFHRYSRR